MAKGTKTDKGEGGWPDFLIDAPAETDSLNAHDRVAEAMAGVIVSSPKVKMIGLLGGWGSGKSTVVGLVKTHLKRMADPPPHYYVYDTWLRQSDPPRRAFLEGLIGFLEGTDIPQVHRDAPEWRAKLRELDGSSKTTVTAATVTLTEAGLFMLPTLVFIPLGARLIGDKSAWLVTLGWLLSLGPLLMAGFLIVAKKKNLREVMAVLASRGGDSKHEVRTQSADPTAIEFQQRFEAITRTLAGAGERLVIVVDNLDRLPPSEAVTLWSTLRSFFQEAEAGAGLARPNLPVIVVPLDPSAPGRIHGEEEAEGKGQLSRSFVEKTFDVLFHVPPPVLSSWQDYLRGRLRHVFGDRMPDDWPDTIATVYEGLQRDGQLGLSTTPRSLNSFVNALGVLWAQWRSDPKMTAGAMAYFVCRRRSIETSGLRQALENPLFAIDGYDDDWQASVATLYFGMPRDRARELYLGDPIRSAIAAIDHKAFAELAKSPSFDRYLDQVLTGASPPSAFSAARTLSKAALPEAAWMKPIWRKLRSTIATTVGHGPLRDGDAEAVAMLVAVADEPERSQWLTTLAGFAKMVPSDNLLAEGGRPASAFFAAIATTARDHGLSDLRIRLPDDGRVYIAMLAIGGMSEDIAALEPLQSPEAVLLQLCEHLKDKEKAAMGAAATASLAKVATDSIEWAPMVGAVAEAFKDGDPMTVAIAFRLLAETWVFVPALRVATMEFGRDNVLQLAWSRLPPDLAQEDLAAAAAVCVVASTSVAPNDGTSWATIAGRWPDFPLLVDVWLTLFDGDANLARLRRRALDFPNLEPLMAAVAVTRIQDRFPEFVGDYLLEDLPSYFRLMSEPAARSFWAEAATRVEGFWVTLSDLEPSVAAPIYVAVALGGGDRSAVDAAIKARLDALAADAWDAALDHAAEPWPFVRDLAASDIGPLELHSLVADRLQQRIGPLMSNADVQSRERWFAILAWLHPQTRQRVLLTLRDAMAETDAADFTTLLNFGGPAFLGEDGWGTEPYERAATLVTRLLNMPDGVAWLDEHADVVAGWVRRAPLEYRRAAVDAIRGAHNVQGGAVLKHLFALMDGL